jgi:amino acid adenylation domain-containing protein
MQLDRVIEVIVAMLATLKAGGAYVPLDPADPEQRRSFLLQELDTPILITTREGLVDDDHVHARPLLIDDVAAGASPSGASSHDDGASPEDPAYVMFTSGSTGHPKGVVVPHRGVVRLARGGFAEMTPDNVILQLAPLSFDASTFEIWGALLNGGRCVLYPGHGVPDFNLLRRIVKECGVDTMWLTASLFNLIVDQDPSCVAGLKQLLTGGEALSVPHVKRAQQLLPRVQLINGYGPTENTTFTCCYRIPRSLGDVASVPIGRPIEGTYVSILDDDLQPVADGDIGELCAGGDGVALGYLNRPELTRERFVADTLHEGRTIYRTGDRVRQRDDGIIEFHGRVDEQVKLRGHRIELGEIEAHLREHDAIADCVVALRQDKDGDNQLVAYFTAGDGKSVTAGDLLDHLHVRVPDYMIPSHFVDLESMPLTANGKVDRNALPQPESGRPALRDDFVAPRNPLEEVIAKHWCELLDLERVGVHDRFFEVGGSSLKAIQLIPRLQEELQQEIPVVLLFQAATVAEIARSLEAEHGVERLPEGAAMQRAGGPGPRTSSAGGVAGGRSSDRRAKLKARRQARRRQGRA